MSMPQAWTGWRGNIPGPSATGMPRPAVPAASAQTAAQKSMSMIPQQPTPAGLAATLEHLTGRPADPQEVRQVLEETDVTYGDYAPGGEVEQSGAGGQPVR